jgi:hypothetical protein
MKAQKALAWPCDQSNTLRWLISVVNGVVRTGAHTFLATVTLGRIIDASVLMKLEGRLADHVVGTDGDAFPARLTLMGIQANERGCLMPDEWAVKFHELLLAVYKEILARIDCRRPVR